MLLGLFCREATALGAEAEGQSEYQVKAAFLVNLLKYVDWPAEALPATNSPLVIGVQGRDQFGQDLRKAAEGKTINGHPLAIKSIAPAQVSPAPCHILFISASEKRRLPAILEKLKSTSVLTVGETDDFLQLGGIINFSRSGRKIRLGINLAAAEQAGLKISSRLLSVAEVVKGQGT